MGRGCDRRQFLKTATTLAASGLVTAGVRAAEDRSSTFLEKSGGKVFRAGAYAIDATPPKLPVIVNGYTFERIVDVVHDPLHARCLVLDDGTTRVAIAVVDICVMPRDLIDEAKRLAHEATGVPTDRILISATHTHSAPSAMPALGSGADPDYVKFLPGQIAKGIEAAAGNLAPARVGWTVVAAPEHTHSRRWIMRPDRIGTDPFGEPRDRAKMCPAYEDPNAVGPAGPVDSGLSLLSLQSPDGRPIALVANYSMHYFHAAPLSAGYYGRFVRAITGRIGAKNVEPAFVAAMSQGTSGDQMYMDYSKPDPKLDIDSYAEAMAEVAFEAYGKIEHHDWVPLAMAECTLPLGRRAPDEARLAWANQVVQQMGDRPPRDRPEIFAREQIYLHEDPTAELKLQALRIGEMGITAIPCEVYGITGLKIKTQSPLEPTANFTLANGEEGYIPPPEQHKLGGYSTWEARTAGLEEEAEPKIVDAVLGLLEQVSEKPRRKVLEPQDDYTKAVLASKPSAFWRMSEIAGPAAVDASGNGRHGLYEDGVAFYLEGPPWPGSSTDRTISRAAHFAGGRMKAAVEELGGTYSVQMWLSNGMPADARPVAGYFFSRGVDGALDAPGDHLGIGGAWAASGRLIFYNGNRLDQRLVGTTELELKRWYH
ncbi:MAG: hypothetical protein ABIK89_18240, partial [Planctomycetota bacterium]